MPSTTRAWRISSVCKLTRDTSRVVTAGEMVQHYDSLVAEVDRIVTSPYPTQLKGLHDIICTRCTLGDIARWTLSRPCQIELLANCLLEGLRHWPYVLDLLTRLGETYFSIFYHYVLELMMEKQARWRSAMPFSNNVQVCCTTL